MSIAVGKDFPYSNDASTSDNFQNLNCKKIIKSFKSQIKKSHKKIALKYLEHSKNLGLIQTRRDLVYAANGEYVLVLDSDDTLTQNALKTL